MINILNKSKSLIIIVASILMSVSLLVPAIASAQAVDPSTKTDVCEGIAVSGNQCNSTSGSEINNLVADIVNILSWVVGIAAVIMLIVGGLKYVMSAGDSNATKSAKDTILYAIVGLVIAVLAQGIVRFVLQRTTS